VADYFPDLVEKAGDALGVAKSRRFTGLSGCKKVLENKKLEVDLSGLKA
jgi:hypothetical protein